MCWWLKKKKTVQIVEPIIPEPVRDLAKEIDELKLKVISLEAKSVLF